VETPPGVVTSLLIELKQGNRQAEGRLIPMVYKELRRIAANYLRREQADHSLQPTALVHEAYLRLTRMHDIDWQSRSHFFAVSATLMRRILVDHARAQQARKRGDGLEPMSFNEAIFFSPERPADVIALDEALEELAAIAPRPAHIVEMRFFAGMTEEEIATVHAINTRTVKRDWRFAKNWLYNRLSANPQNS
jgi:RNA polymerase sigma factor (TIGR02999 family)